ncbi:putative Major facilitator superfamily domain-containing protein [Seiridium unicorne]|uniref:Major facilitator superfamily domain-containing protein n=1 Tax=Seiridium unicorne TaxID=138068 RepID=A0ABR2V0E8_9PEZI
MAHQPSPSVALSYFAPSTSSFHASNRDSGDLAGSVFLVSSVGDIIRLPIPSKSPRDPLSWSGWRRILAFTCVEFQSVAASFLINVPGSIIPIIYTEFPEGTTGPFSVGALASALTLFAGFGYLINIPLATAVGRRPVMIGSAVLTVASTLWAGFAGDFYQLLVALALQGFAVGGTISMCLMMLLDATFIHERPHALSLYWCIGSIFIKLSTIPLPFIATLATSWRTMYRIWFLVCVASLVLLICFVPETLFIRPPVAIDGRVAVQSATEKIHIYDDWMFVPQLGGLKPLPEVPPQRPWLERLKVQKVRETQWWSILATYAQMPFCFINPLIFWVSLLNACILGCVIFLNLLQPTSLAKSLGADQAVNINKWLAISGAVGALLSIPLSGPLIAWVTRHLSLRNDGIRHAEVYLPGFAVPTISGCLSVLIGGLTAAQGLSPVWQYVASALSMISYNTGNVATLLWITEAFPRWAAAALTVVLFTGNMLAFVFGFKLSPWTADGCLVVLPETYALTGVLALMGLVAVPAAFWGKTVRQYIQGRWNFSETGALRPQAV